MDKYVTEFDGDINKNIMDFAKLNYVKTEYGIIEMFEYLMCWNNKLAIDIYEALGFSLDKKNIGTIISVLFLIKKNLADVVEGDNKMNFEILMENDILKDLNYEENVDISAEEFIFKNNIFQKKEKFIKNNLDIAFIEANSRIISKKYLKILKDYFNGINVGKMNLFEFKNLEEKIFFENEILTLDPKFVMRVLKAFSHQTSEVLKENKKGGDPKAIMNFNIYRESDKLMNKSPYHMLYKVYKLCNPFYNIFGYTTLENVKLVSKLYRFDYENDIKYDDLDFTKLCEKKLKSDFVYLVKEETLNNEFQDVKNASYKYIIYKSFLRYILTKFTIDDINNDVNFIIKNDIMVSSDDYNICDCVFDIYQNRKNLRELNSIFEHHLKNPESTNLYIYDFDNTLAIDYLELLYEGIYVESDNYSKYGDGLLYAAKGIEILSQASKINKPIILTKRYYGETKDLRKFLNKFDIKAYLLPTLSYKAKDTTKSQVLEEEWKYILRDLKRSEGVKNIFFADDLVENFEGIENLKEFIEGEIKTFEVSLQDEYAKNYS